MWHFIYPGIRSRLLEIIFLLLLTGASFTFGELNCFNSECECTMELDMWNIECPSVDINIDIRENQKLVLIKYWSEIENNSLPKIGIGNSHFVGIGYCELSGEPIVHILDQLGIKNVKYLSIIDNILGINFTCLLTGLSGLEGLNMYSNDLTLLPADLFVDLSNVTMLSIHEEMAELPPHIFDPLEKLTKLNLTNNRLDQLPEGIFRNQHQLKELDLSFNLLRNINKTTFEGATSLLRLDLSNNNLVHFEPEIFSMLLSLREIYLSGNEFRELPSQLFANNKNLNILHINENRNTLEVLPSTILANLSHLQEVHISCSNYSWKKYSHFFKLENTRSLIYKICGFPSNLFSHSIKWTHVSLTGNKQRLLPDTIFADQRSLLQLDLTDNELQSLQQGLFSSTTNLVELDLSYNQLTEISTEIFSPLVNLKVLYLDDNHLKTISPDAFSESRNIRYISMENNRIKLQEIVVTKSPFHLLEKLETLKMRNNSIQHIYWDWRTALPDLKELDLSLNNITTLDYRDLTFQQNKIFVNMSQNQVRTIDFEDANQETKRSENLIDLSYNPLDCDCKLLPFLMHVRGRPKPNFITDSLFCDNPDYRLFRDFKPEELTCLIENCPHGCTCRNRTYDTTLIFDCSNNNLTKVPDLPVVPTNAFKAIELHIENNELLELSTTFFDGYAAVTKTYATGNNISYIAVQNLPTKLTHLDLSYNNLKRLDSDVIHFFNRSHSLIQLTLAGNPWDCNCRSRSLFLFAEHQSIVTDYKNMFCATPKNTSIHSYFIDIELCQEGHGVIFTSTVSFLSISLLITIIVIVRYKYETEIKIWMYSCPWLRGIFSEVDVDKDKKYDAFVSYAHKDQEFIGTTLVPELERDGPIRYNLCVHVRDFIVGDKITDQIIRAINESRRTIIVLSKHFIESVWACLEFRLAHQAAVEEGRTRVIVIMYGDIGDIDSLEPILRAYLKTNTYLEWGDPRFWDRLRYAMPHSVNSSPNENYQATTAV